MMLLSYTNFWSMLLGSAFHTTEVCNSKSKGLCHEKDLNTLTNMYWTDNDVNKIFKYFNASLNV